MRAGLRARLTAAWPGRATAVGTVQYLVVCTLYSTVLGQRQGDAGDAAPSTRHKARKLKSALKRSVILLVSSSIPRNILLLERVYYYY